MKRLDKAWTSGDQVVANLEGWGVFDNSDHGIHIERVDDMGSLPNRPSGLDSTPIFVCDEDARIFVEAQATAGSELHRKAVEFVKSRGLRQPS